MGDHTETIQVDYDPDVITYGQLLKIFWENHNPTQWVWSKQYRSYIFYHNEEQKRLAEKTKIDEGNRRKSKIHTEIIPASKFYLAENYHQKYFLQQYSVLKMEFSSIYPYPGDFIASTAAARTNGYVGGFGSKAQLEGEINSLGLSKDGREMLRKIVTGSWR